MGAKFGFQIQFIYGKEIEAQIASIKKANIERPSFLLVCDSLEFWKILVDKICAQLEIFPTYATIFSIGTHSSLK